MVRSEEELLPRRPKSIICLWGFEMQKSVTCRPGKPWGKQEGRAAAPTERVELPRVGVFLLERPLEMGIGEACRAPWPAGQDTPRARFSRGHRAYKGFSLGTTTAPALALHLETQLGARVHTQPQNQIPAGQD